MLILSIEDIRSSKEISRAYVMLIAVMIQRKAVVFLFLVIIAAFVAIGIMLALTG